MSELEPNLWFTYTTLTKDGPRIRNRRPMTISVTSADITDNGWAIPSHRSYRSLKVGDQLLVWLRNPGDPTRGPHTHHLVQVSGFFYGPDTHPYARFELRWVADVADGAFDTTEVLDD